MEVENTVRESQRFEEAKRSQPSENARIRPLSLKQNLIVAAIALGSFLLGLVPMMFISAGYQKELHSVVRMQRPNVLQNDLATATINARRGEFEQARQQASGFFTDLRAELESSESAFTGEQHEALRPILEQRDDTITTLARNDPSSGDRLTALYFNYLQVKNSALPVRMDAK